MSTLLRTIVMAAAVAGLIQGTLPRAVGQPVDDGLEFDAADWPWWRGPERNGTARLDQDPPTEWSATQNVAWKAPVPGRGHGSPTVVRERVYLATADEQQDTQSVLCFDRASGQSVWQALVHQGGQMRKHPKSSAASGTVACDGDNLFIGFANGGAVFVTALGLDGQIRWQTKICDYIIHQGYGASPAVYQSLVIASADSHAGGTLAALDRKTGAVVWSVARPKEPNYTSPIILHVGGRDQLLLIGCNQVASFDPLTGRELWNTKGATTECVTSTVTDGERIFSSGGYPKNHLAAVLADGSGTLAWETSDRVYVPSLLARDGHLFGVLDAGIAVCWRSSNGQEAWKHRLGGDFTASPVLVGDRIYATNERGETFVYRANPEEFEQLARNQLGDEVLATPAICGGRIYLRVAQQVDGHRQETLYCLARQE